MVAEIVKISLLKSGIPPRIRKTEKRVACIQIIPKASRSTSSSTFCNWLGDNKANCLNCNGFVVHKRFVTVVMEEDKGSLQPVSFWHPYFETRQSEPPNPPERKTDSNGPC